MHLFEVVTVREDTDIELGKTGGKRDFHYIRIIECFLSDRKRFRSFALGDREEVDLFDIIYKICTGGIGSVKGMLTDGNDAGRNIDHLHTGTGKGVERNDPDTVRDSDLAVEPHGNIRKFRIPFVQSDEQIVPCGIILFVINAFKRCRCIVHFDRLQRTAIIES